MTFCLFFLGKNCVFSCCGERSLREIPRRPVLLPLLKEDSTPSNLNKEHILGFALWELEQSASSTFDNGDNRDSDQSISDYDEDFNHESFCGPRQKMGLSGNNEIEMPLLHNGNDNFIDNARRIFMTNSDKEMISDDEENTMGSKFPAISGAVKVKSDHLRVLEETENQDETCTWYLVPKEAKELEYLHENTGSSSSYMVHSDARKISKAASGSQGKAKPRFSFRDHSHMKETSLPYIVKDGCDKSSMLSQLPVGVGTLENKSIDHSMTALLENLQEKQKKQSDVHKWPVNSLDVGNRRLEPSMSKLLEGSQDKNHNATGASKDNNMGSKCPAISGAIKFKNDHLHVLETENQDETCMWSSVLKEAKELEYLHENTGSSSSYMVHSDARKISKAASGSRGKTKPRFSFRYQSHMEETSLPYIVKDGCDKSSMVSQLPVGVGTLEHKSIDHSMTELLENLQEKKKKQSDVHKWHANSLDAGNRHLEPSMAELLEGFQDKNGNATGASKNGKPKGRRLEGSAKRNLSTLGNRNLDKKDSPETIGNGTSSEDEDSDQNQVKPFTLEMRVRTVADQFHEALSAAAANNREILFTTSKQIGTGYYGRLLHVIQTDKKRDTQFWKQLQTGVHSPNKVRCIDVKILSRCLDAKLTVCHCSLGENTEINECAENTQKILDNGRREKTIIFSPTICANVELEVGKLIRVHPPWKEIDVMGNNDSIILCTYFSKITT